MISLSLQLFIDLNWLTHYRKDEAQDYLRATGACDIDIHHDGSEFLKDGVLLVHQAERVENHQRNLDTGCQNDEGPVEANH